MPLVFAEENHHGGTLRGHKSLIPFVVIAVQGTLAKDVVDDNRGIATVFDCRMLLADIHHVVALCTKAFAQSRVRVGGVVNKHWSEH